MKLTKFLSLLLILFFSTPLLANYGKITGVVKDGEFNDVLPFANVVIKDSDKGTTTDFEGAYDFHVPVGTHTVIFSFMGYQDVIVSGVTISEDETIELNVTLKPQSAQLEEVVLNASTAKNSEASMIQVQKKSVQLMDGISVEGLTKTGAGNVAAAVKSIPGVSVQGGKYVYVRGLGDRYTKTMLNGVDIPGLDPDKNTIQMDIFPTGIIDNIQVVKSASADLPADFTGGLVDIQTKEFPVRAVKSISIGNTYKPNMHFNSNFLTAEGSPTDIFGFDNGMRDLPIARSTNIPHPAVSNGDELTQIVKKFNPNLGVSQANSLTNASLSFSLGNQITTKKDNKIGYLTTLSYKNNTSFYEGYETGNYRKVEGEEDEPSPVFELQTNKQKNGNLGINKVLLSGLAGIAYKTNKNKYKLNFLHIQNGESSAGYFKKETIIDNAQTNYEDFIGYTQRSISNLLLSGSHALNEGMWKLEWKISPTKSIIKDKDIRTTPFEYFEGEEGEADQYVIGSTNPPRRIWRNLDEINSVNKLDITHNHTLFSNPSKLKFGLSYVYKQRDFSIDEYRHNIYGGGGAAHINGNADQLLTDTEIWNPDSNRGTTVTGNYEIANTYDASQKTISAYISESFRLFEKVKSVVGIRVEKFESYYTGETGGTNSVVYKNAKMINKLNLFPSINFIYSINKNNKIRASYSKTTARPSFKEVSIAKIFDPLRDQYFIGNPEIRPTYIDNADLRFESYGKTNELFAVSVFYKYFTDPIELSIYSASAPDNLTPRNVEDGTVYGAELEIRKNMGFIGLEKFSVNVNTSYIQSIQKMDKSHNGEYQSRYENRREGEIIKETRQLQGQSPYLINTGITFHDEDLGLQSTLYYNVQGETLKVVGIGSVPDVYTKPFNNLNFNISKKFGKNNKSKIKFQVSNILDEKEEGIYKSFKATDQIYESKDKGRGFSIGYSYKF